MSSVPPGRLSTTSHASQASDGRRRSSLPIGTRAAPQEIDVRKVMIGETGEDDSLSGSGDDGPLAETDRIMSRPSSDSCVIGPTPSGAARPSLKDSVVGETQNFQRDTPVGSKIPSMDGAQKDSSEGSAVLKQPSFNPRSARNSEAGSVDSRGYSSPDLTGKRRSFKASTRPLGFKWCTCLCLDWLAHAITEASNRYGQRRRPRKIFLVRHGQSLGNVDATAYGRIPDNKVPLTAEGHSQAVSAGAALARLIGADESILALVSPYQRTQETLADIQKELGVRVKKVVHEPNLREQDFGNFQDPEAMNVSIKERQRFGRFFYRFPHGESGADVYSRVESFMSSLFRHMDNPNRAVHDNVIIVSHGIVMRMFLMRFFRWTVEEYELVFNPDNCAIWMLVSNEDGEYSLVTAPNDPQISAPVAGIDGHHQSLDCRMSRCHNRRNSSRSSHNQIERTDTFAPEDEDSDA